MAEEKNPSTNTTENPDAGPEVAVEQESNKSKKILFIMIGAVVLLVAGAIGFMFTPVGQKLLGKNPDHPAAPEKLDLEKIPKTTYYELPELFVNLNTPGKKISFLKIAVSIELSDVKHASYLDQVKPRIIDHMQVYLRQLKVDDFKGSAGLQKLREELLIRINAAASPVKVVDVLFKEMLVQ